MKSKKVFRGFSDGAYFCFGNESEAKSFVQLSGCQNSIEELVASSFCADLPIDIYENAIDAMNSVTQARSFWGKSRPC